MAYMKKKGNMLVFLAIISVLVAIFVFIAMPKIAESYASGKIALKIVAARDIALTLNTIYAYPYDVKMDYDVDLSDFTVKIADKEVQVSFASLSIDPKPAEYPFVPVGENPNFILNKPKKIAFGKKEGKLTVT